MKKTVWMCALTAVVLGGCASKNIVENNFKFAGKQLKVAFKEIDARKAELTDEEKAKNPVSPRTIEPDGKLRLVPSRDWTSGFFPGELWYMYQYTNDAYWRTQAEAFTAPIEDQKTNGKTHDMGFKIYCSFGNGYRLTGNEHYRDVMLESAATLTTRYNPIVGATRSWDHNGKKWRFPVIIDNMMNLELLFWAFRESGDSTFYNIAVQHARTTIKNHFREDNSSYHVIDYDPETGEVLNRHTHQGYSHDSAWSRGQAWGLYGFTMSYRETKLPEFLEQAQKIAQFIFTHPNMPADLIPYWDFNAPNIPDEPRDMSAATVAASALYELSMYDADNAAQYLQWADTILDSATKHYRNKVGTERGFLLGSSTGSKPHDSEVDVPLVYADYYFLEALLRKEALGKTGTALF